MGTSSGPPELAGLTLGDPPERWDALGFTVKDGELWLGGVCLQLGGRDRGIVAWSLRGVDGDLDGLPTADAPPARAEPTPHPNGALALDHVVVVTPDFERTAAALEAAGMPLRRQVEREDRVGRMGFRRLGPAILELVEAPPGPHPGPAMFWGLVVVVEDLDALASRLGDRLGKVRPAVQPGRRIARLRDSARLGEAVAFMDPEGGTPGPR